MDNGVVVIDDFFSEETLARICRAFPKPDDPHWFIYDNPLEKKMAYDDVGRLAHIDEVLRALESPDLIRDFEVMLGRTSLFADPHRRGAGLHCHLPGGFLGDHVDFSVHADSGKTRCANLIVYVTPNWQESWGGNLKINGTRILPKFNRAVLFDTNAEQEAVHGVDLVTCPDGITRNSMAVYYMTDDPPRHGKRLKASFVPPPDATPQYHRLCKVRSTRRLETSDLR